MTKESGTRLLKGLTTGIIFGFLLHRGGVTQYNVIVGQLLLEDFTVLKVMLTAVAVGMPGIYFLYDRNLAELSPKNLPLRRVIPGGLIFGAGFALLGYCPGTLAGAVGQGSLDALIIGLPGIIIGSGLYAVADEKMGDLLDAEAFSRPTIPLYLHRNHWRIIVPAVVVIIIILVLIELILI